MAVSENALLSAPRSTLNEYAELKQLVKEKGLLDKQPVYYILKFLITLSLPAASVALLLLVNNPWLQLLNAVFFAFAFVQVGFLTHDIGHRQVFADTRRTTLSGLILSNLLVGVSQADWVFQHNQHHSNPNNVDLDPDIDIPVVAFSEEQALSVRGPARFLVKYQAFFFLPLMSLVGLGLHSRGIRWVFQKRDRAAWIEGVFLLAYLVLYLGLVFSRLSPLPAVLFIIIHQLAGGLYLGTVAAVNHKGMIVLDETSQLDFLRRQVLTSRNVKAHPLTDFWYGGLNYQIEHHLFPTMPRNKLKQAQQVVRTFCETHGISYHETTMGQSYREILQFLHQVSAPLRDKNRINLSGEQHPVLSNIP